MSNIKPVVTVTPKQIQLLVGTWYYGAHAEVNHPDACCKCVRWYSSNTSVATVNPSSGYIYANAVGTAQIIAVSTCDETCYDSLTVTVANTVSVDHISLDHFKLAFAPGECVVLSPTVVPANATNKTLNWQSSNPSVATVNSNGKVCGVSLGTAIITAVATDSSGASAACSVRVTNDVLVDSVSVSPSCKCVEVGDSFYLSATVLPANATNKSIIWSTNNSAVASVNVNSGLVTTHRCGRVTVSAVATDGNVIYGTCDIRVNEPTTPTGIAVSPKVKTLFPNETANLTAVISPSGAANSQVQWTSGDTSVATVGLYTGIVTAINDGSATITATIVGTNISNTCTITVDSRERVTIKKDSHSFYLRFPNGKKWRFIGLDLSKRSEYYSMLNPPARNRENYDLLIAEEQRYLDNIESTFSINEIAFSYLFDPIGIEYYMRTDACNGMDILSGEYLLFKDHVYEAIFGTIERINGRFYFTINNDGEIVYTDSNNISRTSVYSNAEILFGFHTLFNWSNFWQSILEGVFGMIPGISQVLLGVDMYKALFFSESIVGATYGLAAEFLEDYAAETTNTVLLEMLGWPKIVFDCFVTLSNAIVGSFQLDNMNDLSIYAKIQEQSYFAVFEDNCSELSISDIINKCANNQ